MLYYPFRDTISDALRTNLTGSWHSPNRSEFQFSNVKPALWLSILSTLCHFHGLFFATADRKADAALSSTRAAFKCTVLCLTE